MSSAEKQLEVLFLDALGDILDAEKRFAAALPILMKAADGSSVQTALEVNLKETIVHKSQLELVFRSIDQRITGKTCAAAVGLANEAAQVAANFAKSPALSAALIAVVQKIVHYKIASYGCLHEWAVLLEYRDAAKILDACLDDEKYADEALTELARSGTNEGAALGETRALRGEP